MAEINILSGIYTGGAAEFRVSYPVNLVPVPEQSGISAGYLRPADGLVQFGTGPGIDRGGIAWNGVCYRVMGTSLVKVNLDGTVTTLGDVGGSTQVSFDYSFDRLAVASNGNLFYWNGTTLTQVTDVDLGTVLDVVWVDGYFMTTDGTSLVVTELNNPAAVDPLKYGSAEMDPDPIKGLIKLRKEVYAANRYTIEVMDNIGGNAFPFERIEGALITKGVVGTHAMCAMNLDIERVAFLGSGKNEPVAVYFGRHSQTTKISTREIDQLLLTYSEADLAKVVLEARVDKSHQHLLVHLPDRTAVYDAAASLLLETPVWFYLTTATEGFGSYKARNLVWCYDRWLFGDPTSSRVGTLSDGVSSHYGQINRWEFGTEIVYNASRGALFTELELVCLTGRTALGGDPQISTAYSVDGSTWSQPKSVRVGKIGDRTRRIVWFQQGLMQNWRAQRFWGDSQAHIAIARLEAQLEPLSA